MARDGSAHLVITVLEAAQVCVKHAESFSGKVQFWMLLAAPGEKSLSSWNSLASGAKLPLSSCHPYVLMTKPCASLMDHQLHAAERANQQCAQAVVCMCPVDVHPDCKEGLAAKMKEQLLLIGRSAFDCVWLVQQEHHH